MKTERQIAPLLSSLLPEWGIKSVVASPGTRNMPLLTAFERNDRLTVTPVLDERTAGFYALGIAERTGSPVALVCTSGSALLNYSPAISEAFYRQIPLIVISADRPASAIGQNRGQTIVQTGALEKITIAECDLNNTAYVDEEWHYANRRINDLLSSATGSLSGPVHINIHFQEPLIETDSKEIGNNYRLIRAIHPEERVEERVIHELTDEIRGRSKVMIFAGQHPVSRDLDAALSTLGSLPNIAVISEHIANLHTGCLIPATDALLSESNNDRSLLPELLICFGGGPISRNLKETVEQNGIETWFVGKTRMAVDCFNTLSRSIDILPAAFFRQLAEHSDELSSGSDYNSRIHLISEKAKVSTLSFLQSAPWSDLKAATMIINRLPDRFNIQCSNGMMIRYLDLMDLRRFRHIGANRGVNGIDGSVSTAIGSASVANGPTVLFCGDLSARYDIGALLNLQLPDSFKIVIFDNGGGDIFRCIKATRHVDEREKLLCLPAKTAWNNVATAAGMKYFAATDCPSLQSAITAFINTTTPAMLVVDTSTAANSQTYINYINRNKI